MNDTDSLGVRLFFYGWIAITVLASLGIAILLFERTNQFIPSVVFGASLGVCLAWYLTGLLVFVTRYLAKLRIYQNKSKRNK